MANMNNHHRVFIEGLKIIPSTSQEENLCSKELAFALAPGETAVIVGPAGSGKTRAALQLSGLTEAQPEDICIIVDGEKLYDMSAMRRAETVSLVPSTPDLLFSCITNSLRREMELSFEFLGRKVDIDSLHRYMDKFELSPLAERDPMTLSGGEKVRAAFALALLKEPKVLIVDEAFEELDPFAEDVVRNILKEKCNTQKISVIEFHSHPRTRKDNYQQLWCFILKEKIVKGTFKACWNTIKAESPYLLPPIPRLGASIEENTKLEFPVFPVSVDNLAEIIETQINPSLIEIKKEFMNSVSNNFSGGVDIHKVEFSYRETGAFRLGPITHKFRQGRVTAVLGKNGSGKTTLLRCIGNLTKGWTGSLLLNSESLKNNEPLHVWAKNIIYCFQNPDDQIYLSTVREELIRTAQKTRNTSFPLEKQMMMISEQLGLEDLFDVSPFDLPRSTRRLITLGSAFIARPKALLLDEPTVALDSVQIQKLLLVLREYTNWGGTAVVVSHDYEFVAESADDIIIIDDGKIISSGSKESGFTDWLESSLTTIPHLAMKLKLPENVWREKELLDSITTGEQKY